jgi:hypothetical protein
MPYERLQAQTLHIEIDNGIGPHSLSFDCGVRSAETEGHNQCVWLFLEDSRQEQLRGLSPKIEKQEDWIILLDQGSQIVWLSNMPHARQKLEIPACAGNKILVLRVQKELWQQIHPGDSFPAACIVNLPVVSEYPFNHAHFLFA